ncbi:hypothetical protein [Peribacillus simplex]
MEARKVFDKGNSTKVGRNFILLPVMPSIPFTLSVWAPKSH